MSEHGGGGSSCAEWKNHIPNQLVPPTPHHPPGNDDPLESFPVYDVIDHAENSTRPHSPSAALENMEIGESLLFSSFRFWYFVFLLFFFFFPFVFSLIGCFPTRLVFCLRQESIFYLRKSPQIID